MGIRRFDAIPFSVSLCHFPSCGAQLTATLPLWTYVSHRVQANIYPASIASNISVLCAGLLRAAYSPRLCATAKADAYVHEIANVLLGLKEACALAVMQPSDAHGCRRAGWSKSIMVLGGLGDQSDVNLLDMRGLQRVISHAQQIDCLTHGLLAQPDFFVWLRFCGEIGLEGFDDNAYRQAYGRGALLAQQSRIAGVGHPHHHANANANAKHKHGIATADSRFRPVVNDLPGPRSTSNSATVLSHAGHAARDDWIRPGLAVFGASPLAHRSAHDLRFKPAMSLHAPIVDGRELGRGKSTGYNASFTANAPTRVGILSCGYGDGYPRHARAGTPVQIGRHLTRTRGTVMRDLMIVDLTALPEVHVGHQVTLWGTPQLPFKAVATAIGTIAADLLTGLMQRVPLIPTYAA